MLLEVADDVDGEVGSNELCSPSSNLGMLVYKNVQQNMVPNSRVHRIVKQQQGRCRPLHSGHHERMLCNTEVVHLEHRDVVEKCPLRWVRGMLIAPKHCSVQLEAGVGEDSGACAGIVDKDAIDPYRGSSDEGLV